MSPAVIERDLDRDDKKEKKERKKEKEEEKREEEKGGRRTTVKSELQAAGGRNIHEVLPLSCGEQGKEKK